MPANRRQNAIVGKRPSQNYGSECSERPGMFPSLEKLESDRCGFLVKEQNNTTKTLDNGFYENFLLLLRRRISFFGAWTEAVFVPWTRLRAPTGLNSLCKIFQLTSFFDYNIKKTAECWGL